MKKLLRHKFFTGAVKFGLAAALIAWLFYGILSNEQKAAQLKQIVEGPKDLRLFALAFGLFLTSIVLSFVRWQALVRALGFDFSTRDALRLGFLGYLFNFVAPGGVGGDIFKAVFIARQFHGRRAQAVATVVLDRIIGLYALLLVATAAVLIEGLPFSEDARIRRIALGTLIFTATGAIFLMMLIVPGFTQGRVSTFLGGLPRTGRIFQQLIEAIRLYREQMPVLAGAFAVSILVHLLAVGAFYSLGRALPGDSPSLAEHFVIMPLAMVVGALPITPNGLGTFEVAVEQLFPILSAAKVPGSRGVIVSLIYRIISIAIAMVGVVLYFAARRDVAAALHEAEESEEMEAGEEGESLAGERRL